MPIQRYRIVWLTRWSVASHAFAEVIGRMDQLVDAVYDRYKDRYFPGEKVFVDLSGDK